MKKQTKSKKAGSSRKAPKTPATAKAPRTRERDPRLPAAGTTIKREYKGKEIRVSVLEDGFRCDGKEYRSLSALASELCGNPANGFLFFKLIERKPATPTTPKPKGKRAAPKDAAPEPAPAPETATA